MPELTSVFIAYKIGALIYAGAAIYFLSRYLLFPAAFNIPKVLKNLLTDEKATEKITEDKTIEIEKSSTTEKKLDTFLSKTSLKKKTNVPEMHQTYQKQKSTQEKSR
jgi:hypothetical protein